LAFYFALPKLNFATQDHPTACKKEENAVSILSLNRAFKKYAPIFIKILSYPQAII